MMTVTPKSTPTDDQLVCIGVVTGARGLRGELRIKSFTDIPEDVASYGPVCDETGKQTYKIRLTGQSKGVLIARFGGIETRTAADLIKGLKFFVPKGKLKNLEDDEFFFTDLVGLTAELPDGEILGLVKAVEDFGGGPFLEVAGGSYGEVQVPFTKAAVPVVEVANGRVVIDPPLGLLEPPEDEAKGSSEDPHKD